MTCSSPTAGAANQTQIPPLVNNLPSSIAPNGLVNSNLIQASGYSSVAAGLTSSQDGILSIQRYLDANGTVAVGAPVTTPIVAGTPVSMTVNDGQMFGSFLVTVTNASSLTALLGNVAVVLGTSSSTPASATSGSYNTANCTTVAVPATAGGAVLIAQNPNAVFRSFRSPETNTAAVWIMPGANPSVGNGLIDLQPGDIYEMTAAQANLYQGSITSISAQGNQTILVTEGVNQ